MADPLLRADRISKSLAGRPVLRDLSWSLEPGECAVILGPSGSGKSVFLSILLGFMRPDSGEITHPAIVEPNLFSRVAVLFQDDALLDDRDVETNLAIALHERADFLSGPFDETTEGEIARALRDVGLDPAEHGRRLPSELSGGMRRRVALARALIRFPEVLIADEPTSGLDFASSEEIFSLMEGLLARRSMSAVIITHDPACAARLGNPIYYFTPLEGGLKRFTQREGSERPAADEVVAWAREVRNRSAAEAPAEVIAASPSGWRAVLDEGAEAVGRAVLFFGSVSRAPSLRLFLQNLRLWGVDSAGLIVLVFALIGVVLEIQAERAVGDIGFSNRLPELLALGLARLAPILTGFLVAGRCGSAVTAQTGWMSLSGQRRALRAMMIEPDAVFIPPLFWSWLVILPALTILGMISAWSAAWLIVGTRFSSAQITARFFMSQLPASLTVGMAAGVLAKALLIAVGLASIAYSGGASPKKSATDVARAITRGLVLSFIWISVVDAALSLLIPD